MSKSIQQKREERDELARDTRNLLDKSTGAEWNDEHQRHYDNNIQRIEALDAEIKREQKMADLEAEEHFQNLGGRETPATGQEAPAKDLFNRWLRGGDNALSAEDWQQVRNAMSTENDTEGGYTVPTEVASSVLEVLKAYGGMREVGTVIQTQTGRPMQYPTSDGTAEEGEIVGENEQATDQDLEFGLKSIGAHKFSSKVVTVPLELLQDSTVNVEQLVRNRIGQRLGRITNRLYTNGTGNDQPMGIVTAAPVGKVGGSGQVATVTYDDLLELEHSVDPAYRQSGRCRWQMHDDSLKNVRKLKDSDGRPLFVPSYDGGIRGGVPPELMNYPITINQHMPTMAADAKSILFGDHSYYIIRDVMAVTLFRFTDSAYVKRGQVGFLAWMRSGGNFVDVGGAVKAYQNAAG